MKLEDPDICTDHALDRRLRLYVDATEEKLRGGLHHSYTCDKSRVGTLGLMNGFMTDPSNPGCWAVPQVMFFLFVCLVISQIGRVSLIVGPRAVIIEGWLPKNNGIRSLPKIFGYPTGIA